GAAAERSTAEQGLPSPAAPVAASELALTSPETPASPPAEEKPKEDPNKPASHSTSPSKFGRKGTDPNQAVFKIATDGLVTQVFSASQASLLALGVDALDRVYIGTGNQGLIFRLDPDQQIVKLVRLETAQIMAINPMPDGSLCVGTGNPARL